MPLLGSLSLLLHVFSFQIELNHPYMSAAHKKLQENLEKLMKPIDDYIEDLGEQYSGLYSEELVNKINQFIDEDRTFEEVVEKREYFQVIN